MASLPYVVADQTQPPMHIWPSDDAEYNGWFAARGTTLILTTARTPGSVGFQGEICWNASGINVCSSENTWQRASFDNAAATVTNKTITGSTNTVHADGLKTNTGVVSAVGPDPASGQTLVAVDNGSAAWAPAPIAPQFFGAGASDVVFSTNTTLAADVFARNITVGPGVIVSGPYRLFATGTLALGAGSNINANGRSASGATGGVALAAGSLGGGSAGGAGGALGLAGAVGGNASSQTQIGTIPPRGGSGGSGNSLLAAGGTGGTTSAVSSLNGGPMPLNDIVCALRGRDINNIKIAGGSGGGGGGGGALLVGGSGGGGGGGAGVLMIAANTISGSGTISAIGGAGGIGSSAGAGNKAGGGGGGGGGVVIIVKNAFADGFTAAQVTAAGGLGGASGGTGANNGVNGGNGIVVIF